MLSVSEVANRFQVTPHTVRSWEAKGIIKPDWVSPTGRRYYQEENVERLYSRGIKTLRGSQT